MTNRKNKISKKLHNVPEQDFEKLSIVSNPSCGNSSELGLGSSSDGSKQPQKAEATIGKKDTHSNSNASKLSLSSSSVQKTSVEFNEGSISNRGPPTHDIIQTFQFGQYNQYQYIPMAHSNQYPPFVSYPHPNQYPLIVPYSHHIPPFVPYLQPHHIPLFPYPTHYNPKFGQFPHHVQFPLLDSSIYQQSSSELSKSNLRSQKAVPQQNQTHDPTELLRKVDELQAEIKKVKEHSEKIEIERKKVEIELKKEKEHAENQFKVEQYVCGVTPIDYSKNTFVTTNCMGEKKVLGDITTWNAIETAAVLFSNTNIDINTIAVLYCDKFNGETISDLTKRVNFNLGDNIYSDFYEQLNNTKITVQSCAVIIDWIRKHSRSKVTVQHANSNFAKLLKLVACAGVKNDHVTAFVNTIAPIIFQFEDFVKKHSVEDKQSTKEFYDTLFPFGLANTNGHAHVYRNECCNSSYLVGCDFAETFPEGKYEDRELFLFESNTDFKNVLIQIEAPGTGKTHFAFHLMRKNIAVIPIYNRSVKFLVNCLSMANSNIRQPKIYNAKGYENERQCYEKLAKIFVSNTTFIASLMIESCVEEHDLSIVLQYLYRYLTNGGSSLLGSVPLFDFNSTYKQYPMVFMFDEGHLFANQQLYIPRVLPLPNGSLLTLLTSAARTVAPIFITSTMVKMLDMQIEIQISERSGTNASSKGLCERFSYHFKEPLPVLHSRKLVDFLKLFITPSLPIPDQDNIWLLVSAFLQGTFRRTEHFLQNIFLYAKNPNHISTLELIVKALKSVVQATIGFPFQYESLTQMEMLWNNVETNQLFLKLALFGKVQTGSIIQQGFSEMLLTNSESDQFQKRLSISIGSRGLFVFQALVDILGVLFKKKGDGPNCIPLIVACSTATDKSLYVEKAKNDYLTTNLTNMYHSSILSGSTVTKDEFGSREHTFIKDPIQLLMNSQNMFRILFHPQMNFESSLKDRIDDYSSGKDSVVLEISRNAVVTDKGHIIYEITADDLEWKNYISDNNLKWLLECFCPDNTGSRNP